ncbi:60S acidic ribosomal protein P1 [Helicocarpus griseus UAMH5409]|uniref:Large ribosomal subunit protein P1 n=1 Tax=Helicocarpus griseus UAMH5409 TaxID=1447875 RepID=A0A2B7WUI2_9EURO|nr:60S acidic ribosomal protein P1 [Helicocarpus griseus UAMH5409]
MPPCARATAGGLSEGLAAFSTQPGWPTVIFDIDDEQQHLSLLSPIHPPALTTSLSWSTGYSSATMSTAELAVSYAALILADDGVDITAEKLQSILKAANVQDVEPIWTSLFAKALEGKDVKDLLLNIGSGAGAAPAAGGAAPAGGEAAAEEKAEEKKEEEKEESDEDMGFGLFD